MRLKITGNLMRFKQEPSTSLDFVKVNEAGGAIEIEIDPSLKESMECFCRERGCVVETLQVPPYKGKK